MNNPFEKNQLKTDKDVKPEPVQAKTDSKAETQNAPTILVSHTDAYIHDRMKAQPKNLQDIDVQVEREMNPTRHRLSLPVELLDYEDRYVFRWIFRNKQAIDWACNVKGWLLVNRRYFPDLPDFLFTVNGSIEEGDNILGFMKKDKARKLRETPGKQSTETVHAVIGRHKGNPNYYVPKDEEAEEEKVIGL